MKTIRTILIVLMAVVFLHIQPAAADLKQRDEPPATEASAGQTSWIRQVIHDAETFTGTFTDIAIDPITGIPYISYYDQNNHDLMLARRLNNPTGNCGPDNTWKCEVVASEGDVGLYNSIDVRTIEGILYIDISYVDHTNKALMLYYKRCDQVCFSGNQIIEQIGSIVDVGWFSSLKLYTNGKASIAYTVKGAGANYLKLATEVDTFGSDCANASHPEHWKCTLVDASSAPVWYVSLDLNEYGEPFIAYHIAGIADLKFAFEEEGSGCGTDTGWTCLTLDSDDEVGMYAALYARKGVEDRHRIAYYDATNGKVKYGEYVESGGSCSFHFTCRTIDFMDYTVWTRNLDMVVIDQVPYIAYHYLKGEPEVDNGLKVAHPVTSGGNCAPNSIPTPPYYINRWRCDIIEGGGIESHVGHYVSITGDGSGKLFAAYHKVDQEGTNGMLMLAFEDNRVYLPNVIR